MRIRESQFKAMPPELQALFNKCANPGSEEVLALFPQTTSGGENGIRKRPNSDGWGMDAQTITNGRSPDAGSAARFFYCAKASKQDRAGSCSCAYHDEAVTSNKSFL